MSATYSGHISKMKTQLQEAGVQYQLPLDEQLVPMNELIGKTLTLSFEGVIHCTACGAKTKKSFSQGYCYRCMTKLAQCDTCIMSPEKCHFAAGTCREPEWGEANCNIDHFVYLANSSGVKVGITRGTQVPTRWMDQGAIQAIPIARVATRHLSGLMEVIFKQHVADKTNWRKMLKGEVEDLDLAEIRNQLFAECAGDIQALQSEHGIDKIQLLDDQAATEISYPVEEYPTKVTSLNLDKTPEVSGVLKGIKGQYLIFDTGVINLRKYTSYFVELKVA